MRHLLISSIQQDGDAISSDVDGYSRETLTKLKHHRPAGKPTKLSGKQSGSTTVKALFIKHCSTCGSRAKELKKPFYSYDLVQCAECICRHVDSFPARYCIYCGHNIEPHEPRQAICETCKAVPSKLRSKTLP